MQEITISEMHLGDLNQVCDIERAVFVDPWSFHMFEEELALPDMYDLITLRADGDLIGYGGLLNIQDESHITNLAIKKEYHSQGFGTILLTELIKLAARNNSKNMSLEVKKDNVAAQNLYKKFDFQKIALRKHYYGYEDHAYIMSTENINDEAYLQKIEHLANEKINFDVKSYV